MRLGIVSTYPPRRCGLAGHAAELVRALSADFDVVVCAVDRHALDYPDEVVAVVGQDRPQDYVRAALVLAEHAVDAVLIQHDEDIFTDPIGSSHLLELAHELRRRGIPYLVSLHSMRRPQDPPPDPPLGGVSALAQAAAGVLVFTEDTRRLVVARYRADEARVHVVPFGVPTLVHRARSLVAAPVRPMVADALAAMEGRRVLTTFGVIAPHKGVETAIRAFPAIVAKLENPLYVVAGETSPDVVGRDGEAYREHLGGLVAELGLTRHVRFVDARLTLVEVAAVLGRTDIYLAPSLSAERTCSGSLTYAVAAGCATVAGSHPYSSELLGRGGILLGSADPAGISAAVLELLGDSQRLRSAQQAPDARRFTWPAVAGRVGALLRAAAHSSRLPAVGGGSAIPPLLPGLRRVDQLARLARTAEDQARVAVVASSLMGLPPEALPPAGWTTAAGWAGAALRHLGRASEGGWALWGLAAISDGPGVPEPLSEQARCLREALVSHESESDGSAGLEQTALAVLGLASGVGPAAFGPAALGPAGLGSAGLGSAGLGSAGLGPAGRAALAVFAGRLDAARRGMAWRGAAWPWFAERLGGQSARLPHALIVAGHRLGDDSMIRCGIESLDWLGRRVGLAAADGVLRLPSTDQPPADRSSTDGRPGEGRPGEGRPGEGRPGEGWPAGRSAKVQPTGDQPTGDRATVERSVDAGAFCEAFAEAYRVTGAAHHARLARRSFDWFLGANRHGSPVYDAGNGTCAEGIGLAGVVGRHTARATFAYFGALLALVSVDLVALPEATAQGLDLAAVA